MTKYVVSGIVTISTFTEVEAETPEDAKAMASDRQMQGLCHQCSSGNPSDEWVTSGELDGEPVIERVAVE